MVSVSRDHVQSGDALEAFSKWTKCTCQIEGRTVTVLDAEALVESIAAVC